MKKAIQNGRIVTENEILEHHILVFDQHIQGIYPEDQWKPDETIEIIDAKGCYVSPGFIDVHIHGVAGCDTMDGTYESLQKIADTLLTTGVTSFLATTMTQSWEAIYKALDNIRSFRGSQTYGARVLGAHMEGPFISNKFKGAHDEQFIYKPEIDVIRPYLDVIKVITFAPEVEGAEAFMDAMRSYPGIVLSVGHSGASFKEVENAYAQGAHHMTHCFNGMRPLHHREPGVVGAALTIPFSCELICDNIHVSPDLYSGFVNIKGKDKTVLITDSMRAGCLKEGEYELGGQKVIVQDGSVRLENGTLAGSVLTLNQAIQNIWHKTSMALEDVIQMATLTPAKVLGIEHKKGSIVVGKDADLCIHDENMMIKETIVSGNCEYRSEHI